MPIFPKGSPRVTSKIDYPEKCNFPKKGGCPFLIVLIFWDKGGPQRGTCARDKKNFPPPLLTPGDIKP